MTDSHDPIIDSSLMDESSQIDQWQRDGYVISTRRDRLDYVAIHHFLTHSYWASGISLEQVRQSIDHSFPFGVYVKDQLIGFARVITDYTTYGYLADVFILESYRGRGLGSWLVETVLAHGRLQGLRGWGLKTIDAAEFYQRFGFRVMNGPAAYLNRAV